MRNLRRGVGKVVGEKGREVAPKENEMRAWMRHNMVVKSTDFGVQPTWILFYCVIAEARHCVSTLYSIFHLIFTNDPARKIQLLVSSH